MRVVVTGAGGFIGRALVEALSSAGDHEITAVDTAGAPGAAADSTEWLAGDIASPGVIARLFAKPCDALVHLATVPGGAAEDNRSLARRVNVDATLALLEAVRANPTPPRVVFASSIAVYGDIAGIPISDDTAPAPTMVYGAHKAMAETWIATLTRRVEIDGLSLRLPGIVARPRAPSGMKSAFMSNLFHAARAGETFTSPVSAEATMWLMSRPCVVQNFCHALALDASSLPTSRALTLPGVRLSMRELVAAVARAAGCSPNFVNYAPDEALEAGFGRQPPHSLCCAAGLGFSDDGSIEEVVENAFSCV